jgi:hypothetical protein
MIGPSPAKMAIFAGNLHFLGTSPTVWTWQVLVVVQKLNCAPKVGHKRKGYEKE